MDRRYAPRRVPAKFGALGTRRTGVRGSVAPTSPRVATPHRISDSLRVSHEDDDLVGAIAEARAYLEWERDLGGIGLRRTVPRPRPRPDDARAPAVARPAASAPGTVSAPVARPDVIRIDGPRLPLDEVRSKLTVLADEAASCTACRLHTGRTKSVFSRGSMTADLVFVGEGPGYNEDQQGAPFVGAAGQLLDKMIVAMGYAPDDVYICNVVKCRPPENRTPEPDESRACSPFLNGQLELVKPRAIVALGRCAAEGVSAMPEGGRGWRGTWASYRGIPVMPTYHPAYLLRSPEQKRVVWDDLQKVMALLGRRSVE